MRTLISALAFVLWSSSAKAVQSWVPFGPGGGGAFTSVDVSSSGRVLIGGDVSGLYGRSGNNGDWTRIGTVDGVLATKVINVKFSRSNPSIALGGTGNGMYRSTTSGVSWTEVGAELFGSSDVSAIGWGSGSDSTVALAVWAFDTLNSAIVKVGISEDKGATWSRVLANPGFGTADSNGARFREPIKVVLDPATFGASRDIYVLMGVDVDGGAAREIWRSQTNGTDFAPIVQAASTTIYPIDIAMDPSATVGDYLVATSDNATDPTDNDTGKLYVVATTGATPSWTPQDLGTANPTGAVWLNSSSDMFVLNVQKDACGTSPPAGAGLWKKPSGGNWSRIDDGVGGVAGTDPWEFGWIDGVNNCNAARGQPVENVANAISGQGEYWVTASFVWHYSTSGDDKFVKAHTDAESSPWNTTKLDNVNPVAVGLEGGGALWAGYYDIGLWRQTSYGWENRNSTDVDWAGGDHEGGNVNALLFEGSTMYAIAAPSSKSTPYAYRLWKSTSSGSPSSWAKHGSSGAVDITASGHFLRSLTKDPTGSSPKYWISRDGDICSSSDGSSWSASTSVGGLMTVKAYNGVVIAGGWKGIYRSTNNGSSWSLVTDLELEHDPDGGGSLPDCYGNTTSLHTETWHGIHDIFYNATSTEWWAVSYMKATPCNPTGLPDPIYGLLRSTDQGASWSPVYTKELRRGVYVDSCGLRAHLASGDAFSSGPNSDNAIADSDGKQTCRWSTGTGGTFFCVAEVVSGASSDPYYRNPFGARIIASEGSSNCKVYVGAPGYGIMAHNVSCWDGGLCSTEFRGGGDEMGLLIEALPARPQTHFTLAQAREAKLALYDISGRKVVTVKPGVFFERVEVGPGQYRRRTVVVTP